MDLAGGNAIISNQAVQQERHSCKGNLWLLFESLKEYRNTRYYQIAIRNEAISQANTRANNIFEQSRLEKGLEDSFKAIEADLGDPPKDEVKFRDKIKAIGLDPDRKFGLDDKPIYQVITRHECSKR